MTEFLVFQDLFDPTVEAKFWKQKRPRRLLERFNHWLQKIDPRIFALLKDQHFLDLHEKFAMLNENKFTPSREKSRLYLLSANCDKLKNLHSRYMEYYGYKYHHKTPQFVTTLNSRFTCSNDLRLKDVKASNFWPILHSKHLREYGRAKSKIGDRVCIYQSQWFFQNVSKSLIPGEKFEKCCDSYQWTTRLNDDQG